MNNEESNSINTFAPCNASIKKWKLIHHQRSYARPFVLPFVLLIQFLSSSCQAFHNHASSTIISSRTTTTTTYCTTPTYASRVLGSIYLNSWTVENLKQRIKQDNPPRGLLSKLKRKQDCIEYLIAEHPDCYEYEDVEVDLLIQEYLSSTEEDKVAVLKEALVNILIAMAPAGAYDKDDIRGYTEEEMEEYRRDSEKIEQALDERQGRVAAPPSIEGEQEVLNNVRAVTAPAMVVDTVSTDVEAELGDECLWEMQVAPGYEASDNTFVFKNKADGSYLVPKDLR